ncbi:glycerol kinase [Roseobacter denitrificans]|uniref:Glycerol kinase n=1 Tax=Roseobacter denitrificans (strain ATCC 33942 / OCh 114) TaxID=375451 RepID=GLPK_ROSDO|nr:glycerol kinase GlpK [Roseobacter denitrificans]Q165D5.1 RecName: Full=Glycerol kinase; AltName: Full=ATP:glycerol 3-phosphotransferase; AltName: Full=Glycerokinase; Short=GK [Roseobacter denitrificans OCh 114]ABG32408.1 glycerol kinase [Roseobacter denitrificans OCh 114]AVL51878.1 glycerol kinase [Roseobacter denitrificans]SFF81416.1 glycerol kinase [Roseobacter denitrificans OCh 114]
MTHILAIDQGTTSSRAIIFDASMNITASAQEEFAQHYPDSGWVEHDPGDLWATTAGTCRAAIEKAGLKPEDIAAIGITNQRETVVVWDKTSGQPVYNAIVWQDRRTAAYCKTLRDEGHDKMITARTGLLADPYFSATKLKWILDNVEGARDRATRGELLFGTVDTFLIWKLTGGAAHVTDATNAARTSLYDIHKGRWSQTICALFDIPQQMLPEVKDCAADFGVTRSDLFGRPVPILGVAGDQQAATIGQACFEPGMLKSTYGTGCFALLNTGDTAVASSNRLLTTIAYQFDGKPTYALEGSIFVAGAVVQWLRDGLQTIRKASETQAMAERADPNQNVVLVPAFVGLGAPYWDAECRGAVFGLTRNSGPDEFARAALESVGYQTRDLLDAMTADWQGSDVRATLRVDGGMSASDWAMQFLSDIIDAPVDRPKVLETTALGAAWLAGQRAGLYPDQAGFAASWALEKTFAPQMDAALRDRKYAAWKRAVDATLRF